MSTEFADWSGIVAVLEGDAVEVLTAAEGCAGVPVAMDEAMDEATEAVAGAPADVGPVELPQAAAATLRAIANSHVDCRKVRRGSSMQVDSLVG